VDSAETEEQGPAEVEAGAPTAESGDAAAETRVPQTGAIDGTVESLILEANDHYEAAEEAQRAGDWATYGRELKALQAILQELMELTDLE
jgi:uncharacterized membrane protein (UPF0182 family)